MDGEMASAWADRVAIKIKFRPTGAHARIVGRRSALPRDAMQLERDGVAATPQAIVDESAFANNCMLSARAESRHAKRCVKERHRC